LGRDFKFVGPAIPIATGEVETLRFPLNFLFFLGLVFPLLLLLFLGKGFRDSITFLGFLFSSLNSFKIESSSELVFLREFLGL
jgi:hypothetical protein